MSRLQTKHLTRPDVALPLVYLLFIILAIIALKISIISKFILSPNGAFQRPSLLAYVLSFLGIVILGASANIGMRFPIRINPQWLMPGISLLALIALILGTPLPVPISIVISIAYPFLLLFVSKRMNNVAYMGKIAYFLALAFSATILLRGIPILSSAGRASTAVDPSRALFHGFAVFAAALLTAGHRRKWAALGVLSLVVIGLFSGFKSDAVAVLLAAVITGILLDKISMKELLASGTIILLILTGISTFIAIVSYEQWKIPPPLYIVYRAGFTFSVFGMIVEASFPFGYLYGSALLDPTQMVLSSTLLSQYYPDPHIITSTFLGPGMLDFGVLGLTLSALFIGLYLGILYNLRDGLLGNSLYAIALTHSFILVEVGLQMTSILFYISLLYLMLVRQKR